MRKRSTARLIAAEIAAVAINIIPLGLWFFEDYPAETTMIIYAIESAAAIIFAVLCVLIVSPSYDPDGTAKYKRKSKLVADFLIISAAMMGVLSVFMGTFIVLVLKAEIDLSVVLFAFSIVLIFQAAEFVIDIATLRPLPLKQAEFLLTRSFGKAALLFLGVFLGIFLAAMVNEWFVVPFIILKTIADIGEPIQYFLGNETRDVALSDLRT